MALWCRDSTDSLIADADWCYTLAPTISLAKKGHDIPQTAVPFASSGRQG
jgi:hypothetical protein